MFKITYSFGETSVCYEAETVEAHYAVDENDGWVEWKWTPERPFPKTFNTIVDVRFQDGSEYYGKNVRYWAHVGRTNLFDPKYGRESIIAYKVIKDE